MSLEIVILIASGVSLLLNLVALAVWRWRP